MAKEKSQIKIVNKVMEQVYLVLDPYGVPSFSAELPSNQGGQAHD
jgi:hypothetical protein